MDFLEVLDEKLDLLGMRHLGALGHDIRFGIAQARVELGLRRVVQGPSPERRTAPNSSTASTRQ